MNAKDKAVTVSRRGTRSRRQRKISAMAVVVAAEALAKLYSGEPCFLEKMTDAELEDYVESGVPPKRFKENRDVEDEAVAVSKRSRRVSVTTLVAALRSRAKLDASQCIEDYVDMREFIDRMTDAEVETFA